jgi:RNA polymerase sigma-70 factor (ECF subfamily)
MIDHDPISNHHAGDSIPPDDRFLWDNLRQGNKEAFEVIYRKYVNHLFNYGVHVFMDRALVEDAIQDVFLYVWRKHASLGETDSIRFYLCRSLKREIVRKLKSENRFVSSVLVEKQTYDSVETDIISRQVTEQNEAVLSRAIESLPQRQREIIVHRFYGNLSAEEISSKMSLSIDSTYTLLSRAVRELRKNIRPTCVSIIAVACLSIFVG